MAIQAMRLHGTKVEFHICFVLRVINFQKVEGCLTFVRIKELGLFFVGQWVFAFIIFEIMDDLFTLYTVQ
jgi:hypothetical protein